MPHCSLLVPLLRFFGLLTLLHYLTRTVAVVTTSWCLLPTFISAGLVDIANLQTSGQSY